MQKRKLGSVYLAGPIAKLTLAGADAWRQEAFKYLNPRGISTKSPLRGKEFLSKDHSIIGIEQYEEAIASDSGIVARDRMDVRTSDLMIAYLIGAPGISAGTPIEFGWADAFGTPVITVLEKIGGVYDHPMIRQLSSYRVETLDEALGIVVAILDV